jgi:hypothetical protein
LIRKLKEAVFRPMRLVNPSSMDLLASWISLSLDS